MRPITRLAIGCAAAYAVAAAVIVADGLTDHVRVSDVAVVLGSKVEPDGRPSANLAARLDEAVSLYRRGLARNVIVSGGVDPNGHSEADVMQAYMVARGVPALVIVVDRDGANTRRTADNTARLMKARGFTSVIAVSQYFHISRCRLALRQAGIAAVYTAHARRFDWRDVYSIPREVIGYAAYLAGARG